MLRCTMPRGLATFMAAVSLVATTAPTEAGTSARVLFTLLRAPAPNAQRPMADPGGDSWITRLTPVESGRGILICEPVAQDTDPATANFGAGCGRWLHLMVGGHGELGKTPLWADAETTRGELGRTDLRLGRPDLDRLAGRLSLSQGISHVALGEIQCRDGRYTLTYRLWGVPTSQPVGEPLTVSGSETEIIAGLPGMAKGLSAALGIAGPRVPPVVSETADELRFLGSIPWVPGIANRPFDVQRLHDLALQVFQTSEAKPHPPVLAAFLDMAYQGTQHETSQVLSLGHGLTRVLPENTLVLAEMAGRAALTDQADIMEMPVQAVHRQLERFPNNYALQVAEHYLCRIDDRTDDARKAAERAVCCTPRNPNTWLLLGRILAVQGGKVGQSHPPNELTPEQRALRGERYREQIVVIQKARDLDPQYYRSWFDLSIAAAFLVDDATADAALWKALSLCRADHEVYWWGLQMYQPQWFPRPPKLEKVAQLAAEAAEGWDTRVRVYMAMEIRRAGLPKIAEAALRTDQERSALKEAIQKEEAERQKER
jgi:tetratricopeptide (TPR) repeat protein